jgi:hypothetical protein
METGHGVATRRDIRDLCDLCGVTDQAERDRMMQLALEGQQQAWRQSYDLGYETYVVATALRAGVQLAQTFAR